MVKAQINSATYVSNDLGHLVSPRRGELVVLAVRFAVARDDDRRAAQDDGQLVSDADGVEDGVLGGPDGVRELVDGRLEERLRAGGGGRGRIRGRRRGRSGRLLRRGGICGSRGVDSCGGQEGRYGH